MKRLFILASLVLVLGLAGARSQVQYDTSSYRIGQIDTAVSQVPAKMDSVRVHALRGTDTTRAIVREGLYESKAQMGTDTTNFRNHSNLDYLKNADSTTIKNGIAATYQTKAQTGTDTTNVRNQSNLLYESKTQMGTDTTSFRNHSNLDYLKNADSTTLKGTLIKILQDSLAALQARAAGTNWSAGEILMAAGPDSSYSQTLAEAGIMAKATARTITYGGTLDTLLTTDTLAISPVLTPSREIAGIQYNASRGLSVKVQIECVDSLNQTAGVVLVDSCTVTYQKVRKTSVCAGGEWTIPDLKFLRMVVITAGTPPAKGKSFSPSVWATEP